MDIIYIFLAVLIPTSIISFLWAEGIDYMHRNHPDYTGNDLFGEDEDNLI